MAKNKKPYVFKKYDAVRLSDPIANFHAVDDKRILADMIEESMVDTRTAPKHKRYSKTP